MSENYLQNDATSHRNSLPMLARTFSRPSAELSAASLPGSLPHMGLMCDLEQALQESISRFFLIYFYFASNPQIAHQQ